MLFACRLGRITAGLFLFILLSFGPDAGSAYARTQPQNPLEGRKILILHALEPMVPIFEKTDKGLSVVLQSGGIGSRDQFYEYLDLARNPGMEYKQHLAEWMRLRYSEHKIDLIITLYPEALLFAVNEGRTIFPDVPVVALYLPVGFELPHVGRRVIRQFVTADIGGTLDLALKLVPEARLVYVISGSHSLDRWLESEARKDFRKWESSLEFRYLSATPLGDILATLSDAPPRSLVILLSFQTDATGRIFTAREVCQQLGRVSKAPVFGLFDTLLGHGIAGGSLASFEYIGTRAGELALDILKGTQNPENISTALNVPHVPMFDWRQLRQWNLSEDVLPEGSILINKESTIWDFRYYIFGVMAVIIIETCLILGLFINFQRRRKAEHSLTNSEERLRLAVSSAGAGLWGVDMDTGHLWATDRAREFFGFAPEEPLSYERMLSAIHPSDRERVRVSLQRAAESGDENISEYRVVLPNGSIRWVAARGSLQQDLRRKGKRYLMGACVDITARKLAEDTIREHENELMMLTGRLIYAQEEEFRRLSRELHDDLTQRLAVLAIDAGMLEKGLRLQHPQASQELAVLKTNLIEVSDEVHNLSRQLHPSILDDLGLIQAIQSECDAFSKRTGIAVSVEPGHLSASIPHDISLCLYRVLQESLQNISKHSKASEAWVVLDEFSDSLRLSIRDSGIGFDVTQVAGKGAIGLCSMRERVRLVNGTISVASEPRKGTTIRVNIPTGGMCVQTARTSS